MIELPDGVCPRTATASIIDRGGFLEPYLGGKVIRIDRPGNKFSIAVTLAPMKNDETGRKVVSRLIRAKREGLRISWPMLGFDPGNPVTPTVNGANQAGTTLVIQALPADYQAVEGQFFSLEHNGQHFLYSIAADAQANGAGDAVWIIEPPLRKLTLNSSPIHLNPPKIEGYVKGDNWEWEMQIANFLAISFRIEEAE